MTTFEIVTPSSVIGTTAIPITGNWKPWQAMASRSTATLATPARAR